MYRKPRFLEVLHEIREEMSREADYDVDLFMEMVRSNRKPHHGPERNIRGFRSRAPRDGQESEVQSTTSHRRKRRVAR
ncbi:MAG TPA: hypothetical protein VF717_14765 [Pyrinomonadaceae bacterium]